jgi:heme a synthase
VRQVNLAPAATHRQYSGAASGEGGTRALMAVAEYPIHGTAEVQALAANPSAVTDVRIYFLLLFVLCLGAFVFGVENRLTSDGLFNVRPVVDWMPPLSTRDWWAAFTLHQQDPAFAACGGTESLAEFKSLYWWEWWRRLSMAAVATAVTIGLLGASLTRTFRFALPRLASLAVAALAFWIARNLLEDVIAHVEILKSFNVGQYDHAADVTFASVLVAGVLACAVMPPGVGTSPRSRRNSYSEWLWLAFVVLNICFGALFAARDAAAVWTTWPGYNGHALPPVDQLLTYAPIELNFTFNQYMIQLVHRALSTGLWVAALVQLFVLICRGLSVNVASVRLFLLSAQMLTGITTLILGVPPVLSVVHQVGSIALVACSFVVLIAGEALAQQNEWKVRALKQTSQRITERNAAHRSSWSGLSRREKSRAALAPP